MGLLPLPKSLQTVNTMQFLMKMEKVHIFTPFAHGKAWRRSMNDDMTKNYVFIFKIIDNNLGYTKKDMLITFLVRGSIKAEELSSGNVVHGIGEFKRPFGYCKPHQITPLISRASMDPVAFIL